MKMMLACGAGICLSMVGAAHYASHRPADNLPPDPFVAKAKQPLFAATEIGRPDHTAKVDRDDLPATITAAGTVRPEETLEVGAQVNGTIRALGTDAIDPAKTIDEGSIVHKGTVLAQIGPAIYEAQVDYAEASVAKAKADLLQLEAKRDQAKSEWVRAQALLPEKAIADSDYDIIKSNYWMAAANVAVGRATIQQCEAQLRIARICLSQTLIRSPIDGVIIERHVSVGQTVIADPNAPRLFIIAKDLRRVHIWASVKETDIAYIQLGMPVRFSVAPYPSEAFEGKVTQIRLTPTKVGSCTAYTVVVAANDLQGMLPYLTAKLRFESGRCAKVGSISDLTLRRGRQSAPPAAAVSGTASGVLPGQTINTPPALSPTHLASPTASNPG